MYRNTALFIALAVIWGSAFVAIKAGLGTAAAPAYFFDTPVFFAAVRYDIAGVLMLGYAALVTDRWRPRHREEWAVVVVGSVLIIGGYHALLFVGQRGTTSAAAAVIVSLSPILTTAFARGLLDDERLTAVGLIGMLLGLIGVFVLANPDLGDVLGTRFEGYVFGATVCFALGSVLTRRIDADLPIETMEAWSMIGGAVLMHVVSVSLGESPDGLPPLPEAVALLYLAVVASAIGFLIYFELLDALGAIEINLVSYAAPLVAAVVGFLLLGETIGSRTLVGFLIIFTGFVLLKRREIEAQIARYRA
ncbi:MAG: EamA family transporter [Natronomonas sp.]